jgi:hypothetical protein
MEQTINKLTYHLTGDNQSTGYIALNNLLNGLEIYTEKNHKLENSDSENAYFRIHNIHELASLAEFKQYLEGADGVDLIVLTFDSPESSLNRKFGHAGAKLLALNKSILLKEYHLQNFADTFSKDIISTFENFTWYKSNGGSQSTDQHLLRAWSRYLQSNYHLKNF